ncbi:MAG: hypothetical protein HKO58_11505, partial [Gammaproteobacteria bacterium]|nr:hypothetical protein [Gammaproteobacteria bacterium]
MQAQTQSFSTHMGSAWRSSFNWRLLLLTGLCLFMLLPLFSVLQQALLSSAEVSDHLNQFVLPRVVSNTISLVLGVTLIATILGVSAAWLVSM